MIQDKIFFDEKDPTGLNYNTPFTVFGSYEGRLWSKTPSGSIQYYSQNSDLSAYATTGSNQFNGSQTITGSLTVTEGINGTTTTSSYVEYNNVANKPTLVSGSSQVIYSGLTGIPSGILSGSNQIEEFGYAITGSNGFNGNQSITGSLTVTGQVVAQTLNVQQVTSSVVYSSGSNIFGNSLANTQSLTGSVGISGSLSVNGEGTFTGTLNGTRAVFNSSFLSNETSKIGIGFESGYGLVNSWGVNTSTFGGLKLQISVSNGNTFNALTIAPSGFVGIGTNASLPYGRLEVADVSQLTNAGQWASSTISMKQVSGVIGNYSQMVFGYHSNTQTNGSAYIGYVATNQGTNGYGDLVFGTRNVNTDTQPTERVRITSSGNVGIGVTPSAWNANSRALQLPSFVSLSQQNNGALNLMSYAVETSGNAFTHGDTGVFPARLNMNPNDGTITLFGAGTGTSGSAITWAPRLAFTSTGAATFSGSVTAGGTNDATAIFAQRAGAVNTFALNTNADSSFTLFDHAAGSYTAGITQKSGNVGIGTGAPVFNLDVSPGVSSATLRVGSWTIMENVTTNQAMFGRNVVYQTSIGAGWRNINTAGATAIRMYDDPGDASIAFHLHGSETAGTSLTSWDTTDVKMTIRNNGNVGIGTTSPSEKLHLRDTTTGYVGLRLEGTAPYAGSDWTIYASSTSTNSANDFLGFFSNSATDGATTDYKLRIFKNGNVGIGGGLTDPLGKLSTLGGAVQFMGDYRNHQTIIKSAGTSGTFSGQLTITIPEMSNASTDGYGAYSCEVYVSGFPNHYCHVWFSGYINGGITVGEVTILRSNGGWSVSQSANGTNSQGFQFIINYPDTFIHPTARIIFNKGGSPNAFEYPANSITAVFS